MPHTCCSPSACSPRSGRRWRARWPRPSLSSLRACPKPPHEVLPTTISASPRCVARTPRFAPILRGDPDKTSPHSPSLSAKVGAEVFLKCENLQRAGSFKIRGAYTRMARLSDEEKARGVVAASAGNHAQGVALAAQLLGIRSTVFMPHGAPMPKEKATRAYGADVVFHGRYLEDALAEATRFAERTGAVLIHPFDHVDIVAGQGTAGLEILEQTPDVQTVLVPTGGGGLLAGIAIAVKALRPDVRVVGVQAAGAA